MSKKASKSSKKLPTTVQEATAYLSAAVVPAWCYGGQEEGAVGITKYRNEWSVYKVERGQQGSNRSTKSEAEAVASFVQQALGFIQPHLDGTPRNIDGRTRQKRF